MTRQEAGRSASIMGVDNQGGPGLGDMDQHDFVVSEV